MFSIKLEQKLKTDLILYGLVSFLDLFLQSIDVFLQGFYHSLQFVVFILLALNLGLVIVNLLLKACKLQKHKNGLLFRGLFLELFFAYYTLTSQTYRNIFLAA